MSVKMSTGLMSCVRENSPPLEMADVGAISLPSDTPEPQKRRRFHPLRNLRRIFRRRTVTHADTISPSSSIDEQNSERLSVPAHIRSPIDLSSMPSGYASSLHSATANSAMLTNSVSVSGGFYVVKQKREHSADSARTKEVASDLERDMTDYQRSLSEGRLVESDFTRDALSQSHDSVFSESATASSLSIVLKAELVDALRKRRNRPDASDEDLGLPRSPTTPQRKDNVINQSEGSLSLLSMVSSDMEEESLVTSVAHNSSSGLSHSFVSSKFSSQNTSQNSDEIDFLDASMSSTGSRLSHSAARHKMAIRPKKKGPTRHRTPKDNILPSTPEVNEDSNKMSLLDVTTSSVKHKSHSLPPGINAKMLDKHSSVSNTIETVDSTTKSEHHTTKISSSTTTLTVNKNLSQSFDFNKSQDHTHTINIHNSISNTMTESKSDDGGFFKRLLNRSTKKKKESDETIHTTSDNSELISPKLIVETHPYVSPTITCSSTQLNTYLPVDVLPVEPKSKPSLPKTDKPRSGPASRQRVHPQEISISPKPDLLILSNDGATATAPITITQNPAVNELIDNNNQILSKSTEKLPPKSPKKSPSSHDNGVKTFGYSPKPINKIVFSGLVTPFESKTEEDDLPPPIPSSPYECRYIKAHQYRSDERLIPKFKRNFTEDTFHSLSPPKPTYTSPSAMDEWTNRSSSKLSSILSKIDSKTDISTQQSPKRKSVEKSKSFRVYTENCNGDNQQMLSNVNNMPSLPDLSYDRKIEKPKFLSVKPDLGRSFREISRSHDAKFEINDNNLMRPKDEHFEHFRCPPLQRKNIILETSKSPASLTNTTHNHHGSQNITQIEDNIDKIMKSSFVTVLKKSSTSDLMEIKSSKNNVSITSINSVDSIKDDEFGGGIDLWACDKDGESSSSTSNSPTTTSPSRKQIVEPQSPLSSSSGRVPEFLKIQLNRTDTAARPKSHIVLSRYQKEGADEFEKKQRRFSDDSIDLATDTKPPRSPPQPKHKCSVTSLTKSTESVSSNASPPKSPTTPTKKGSFSPTLSASSMSDIRKPIAANEPSKHGVIIERRKSVSDEKLKFEKKIEEMKSVERIKRPLTFAAIDDSIKINEIRKPAVTEDEDKVVVVLRKKSFSQSNAMNKSATGNNKEDTPELMKVFARRSLKLKDSDDFHVYDTQPEKLTKTKSLNLDSDKENQSSSEEKLDKISAKVEIVQPKVTNNNNLNNNNALKPKENDEKQQRKENEQAKSEFRRNCIITPKPVFIGPNKLTSNYRNTTAFMDSHKVYTATVVTSSSNTLSENINNNNNNQSSVNVINGNNGINNNINNNNVRHTINASTVSANNSVGVANASECSARTNNSEESEFKGILQRRAEWEKRAKEALK